MASGGKLPGFSIAVVLSILLSICSAPRAIPSSSSAPTCGQHANVTLSQYPWMVTLVRVGRITGEVTILCVGVLVPRTDFPTATDLVLTSAPCVLKMNGGGPYVYKATFEDGTWVAVLRRNYVIGVLGFVKLPQPVPYNPVRQPICLPEHARVDDAALGKTAQKVITEPQYAYGTTASARWGVFSVKITSNEMCQVPQYDPDGQPFIGPIPQTICIAMNGRFEGIGAPYFAYDRSLGRYTLWGIYDRESMIPGKHIYFRVADHVQSILEFMDNPGGTVQQN